jgi:hypothetical protein
MGENMVGIGTIVNVAAIIGGGLVGMLLKKGLQQRFQDIMTQVLGLATIFIGISGAMTGMLTAGEDGSLSTMGTAVLIGSLVLGAFVGELINLDRWLEKFGEWLKIKARSSSDPKFVEGFVNASLVVCVGAMAIVGSINDGISHDPSLLFAKSALDCVIVLVMASTYGKGVIFSAIPVGILQGGVTLLAKVIQPLLSDPVIASLSYVGSALIFCVGANLCLGRKFRVANMLPALIFAGVFTAIFG